MKKLIFILTLLNYNAVSAQQMTISNLYIRTENLLKTNLSYTNIEKDFAESLLTLKISPTYYAELYDLINHTSNKGQEDLAMSQIKLLQNFIALKTPNGYIKNSPINSIKRGLADSYHQSLHDLRWKTYTLIRKKTSKILR